jgi:class 3 adenylate cyclase
LTAEDLKDLGVAVVGHRRKLLVAIAALRGDVSLKAAPPEAVPPISTSAQDTAERRQFTVMFCDFVGSTALSARLDTETCATSSAQAEAKHTAKLGAERSIRAAQSRAPGFFAA